MIHLATVKAILASILAVAQPGLAKWSRTDIAGDCSAECRETIARLTGFRPVLDYTTTRATWPGWTRQETRAEGMARFVGISYAMARVAHDPPVEWQDSRGNPYPVRDLWRAFVTIGRHESAFWKAVQSGKILGMAGESCMMQIHPLARVGVPLDSLVGLSRDASERCFRAGAVLLGRSRKACESDARGPGGWWPPTIASYGSGMGCDIGEEWITDRVNTYAKVSRSHALPALGMIALELAEPDDWWGSAGDLSGR